MSTLRISKYDPDLRSSTGIFLGNEWTSVADIGESFSNGVLSIDDYKNVESGYVNAVLEAMDDCELSSLTIVELEKTGDVESLPFEIEPELRAVHSSLANGQAVKKESIAGIIRLALRELIWCKLVGDEEFYIHFGHDYYMYAGCLSANLPQLTTTRSLLFVEDYDSPYR